MVNRAVIKLLIMIPALCLIVIQAYALDYPHFTINNIGCDSCHFVYGTQPSLLPPWTVHTPQDIDDTPYNTLCWSCHNDIDAPYMRTHSSLQTDNSYGNWTVECRVCHNPHYQKQSRTFGSPSYLYSGISTNVMAATITKTGAGWTANAYQGYVVYPNVSQKNYNYKILSNTSDTLTVEGPINLTKASIGNTFAIVYGNLINDTIDLSKIIITPAKSGSKTTRFFNTTGTNSFADGNSTYDGVCEVCHTQTTHFRNNGSGTDQLHTNMASPAGTNCTNCHMHVNGFKGMGGGVHKTHVTDNNGPKLACADCHGANIPPMLADGQNLANTTVCNNCHSVSGAVIAKTYWQSNPGNWTTTGGESGYCGSCHDETPGNSKQNGAGNTAANIVGDNATYGYFVTGHGKTTGDYQRLSWQATMAYGNSAANKQCSACHDLTTAHYNSPNKRLKPGYENDSSNSNCKQCHDPGTVATGDPQWYTTYTEYQNSAHKNKKCTECHDVHGASGNYPGMTKANQENLCYQCHKDPASGGIQNNAISGSGVADDIQQAFGLSSKHDLGTSFSVNFESYTLACVSCHNVHIVTGKYWDAASNKSPVTRFTSNTAVWGDGTGEKMDDYVGSGIYQTPYADVFPGYILPDYPTFCLDCHSSFGGGGQGGIDWDGNTHGKRAANNPGGNQGPYPDYWGIWAQGQIYDANPPAFKVPVGRGFVSFTYRPWDQERRIAGGNYVLSCTDCHEAHGAGNGSMMRNIIRPGTSEPGAESPKTDPVSSAPTACQICHGVKTQEHNGGLFGCGSASCHGTADIHRMNNAGGGGGTTIFNREHVADIRFENSLDDSGTWKMHGRWVDDGNLQSTNSSLNPNSEYLAKFVPGKSGQGFSFDGNDVVELGSRGAFSQGYAQSSATTGMAKAFELTDTGTIEAWIYPTDLTGTKTIASNNKENDRNYMLMIKDNVPGETGPRLVFHADTMDMYESDHGAYSSVTIPLNEWTHVAAVYNRWDTDHKIIRLYVNGIDVTMNTGSVEYSQPLGQAQIEPASWWSDWNMQPFLLGGHPVDFVMFQGVTASLTDYFEGKIDEFNVYNVAKNSFQIRQSIGPVLVNAKGKIGSDQLTVAFSHGVYTNTGASGSLTPSDFILTDTDDSRTISSVSHSAGASTATLTLSSPFDSSEDLFVDKLKVAGNTVFDSSDNPTISLDVVITARSNIRGAIAKDSSGISGIQTGDKVIIKFDIATQGTPVTSGNINSALSLSNSHSWLSGGAITSAVWSTTTNSNDTLTITLSAVSGVPSVTLGDIITLNGTIKDASGVSIDDNHVISGTFGPLPDGAVGYWNMVENYGDGAYDSTDYENHGTLINLPSWTTGVYDTGIYFDGDDDYVEVPDSDSLDLGREGTLEVWAKKDENRAYQVYLAKYATSGNALANFGYVLADVDGKIAVKWGDEDDALTTDCVTVPTGVWNHILATYDGSQMKIFFNGQPIKTGSFLKRVIPNAYPLRIGAKGAGDSYDSLFKGTIDEAVVYNRALTNDEARERYGEPVGPKSAITYDMNGADGIQSGDKVVVKFDGPTNGAAINASNIGTVLALSNGHTWGTISSAAWSTSIFTNDKLTIILSTSGIAPTIAPADTITPDGSVLKDLWGNSITTTIGVGGKFGPLPSGAVAYYDFNEGSGTTVNDSTLNENHGQVRGGVSWLTGRTGGGNALNFNGTDTHVFVQDCGASLDLTTQGTFEFWMRKDSSPTNTYPVIVSKGQPARSNSEGDYVSDTLNYNFYSSSNEERLTLTWGGSGGSNSGSSDSYLNVNGGWKHVVVTYDGDARFYIDGEYVGGSRVSTTGLPNNEPVIFGAGKYFDNMNFFLDGAIDEAIIYNRALSADEVRESSGIPWRMKTAVAYDTAGADGIQGGDRVVITFNGPTQATQITAANIDTALDLPVGKTWKSGSGAIGNAVWSTNKFTNDTLTLILSDTGGAPNLAVGNTITLDGATIKDNMGRPVPVGSVTLSGTFDPLPGDIVGYWNFAEGSGSTANDSSIYNNHGTLQGDASWTAGQDDGALRLDGTGAYVRVNDSNSLDLITRDFYGIRLASRTKGWAVGQSGAILNYTGSAAPGGGTHSWQMEYYSPTTNHLYAVDNYSSTEAYAVGAGGTIIRYNGSSWGNLTNPVTVDLYSVDMLSSTSGWAVGKNNTILRFNGAVWSPVAISSPTATWTLKSVKMISASEGWAAGGDNVSTGVILKWNGSTWTEFATTTLTNMLTSIDMLDSTNGWAIGYNGRILKFDGTSWTQFTSPVAYDLHAVKALSANEAWAVGANRTIMMYDGTTWTVQSNIMEISGLPTLRTFDSVPADPADDSQWFDYTKFDFTAGDSNAIIKHSDGTWTSSGIRSLSWHGATVPTYDGATFEIWAKKNSNKSDQTYLAKQYPNAQTIGQISYRIKEDGSTGKPAFTWNNYANTPGQLICSSAAVTGQWNNIIVTVNSGAQRIYLNGQICGTKSYGNTGLASEYPLMLGTGYYGSADFDGDIDQVTIYNRAMSPDEVWEKYGSIYGSNAVTFNSAVADDSSNGGYGVQAGDRVTITFSGPTRGDAVTAANINSVLNVAGKTWLSGNGSLGSAVWSTATFTNDTLNITFSATGGAPTVAVNDTITLSGLYDSLNMAMTGTIAVSGSFGTDTYDWTLDTYSEWSAGGLISAKPANDNCVELQNWDVHTRDIWGVDMLSPTEGWAVGRRGAIRKWDGAKWKAFPSPIDPYSGGSDSTYYKSLYGIDMLSSTLGWAVYGDSETGKGKVLKFDGTRWSEEAIPSSTYQLYAVKMLSSTDGWAVGISGTILRYDGTSWTTVTSPTTSAIYAIDGVSSNEVWAAGATGTSIFKWDGTIWTTATLPASVTIRSIHMLSSSDGWAVGDGGVIFRYNGSSWSSVASPTTRALYSVHMVSATEGSAVGGGGYSNPGIILRWNGSTWSAVLTKNNVGGSDPEDPLYFYAVNMLSTTDGWAFGYEGAIFRWNGSAWSEYAGVHDYYITEMQFASDTDGWALSFNKMLRYNGATWTAYASPTTKGMSAIDMLSANEGWLAGPSDYFYKYLNGSWTPVANTSGKSMYGVDMLSSTLGWAVGANGTIVKWDGASWTTVTSPTTNYLSSVKMLSSTEGWAVGNSGTIVKWDGTNWTTVASPVTVTLMAVDMVSSTRGWAVGYDATYNGIMLEYNGASWSVLTIPTAIGALRDIRMRSSTEGIAVGGGGVLTYDGQSWKYSRTPARTDYYAAAYTPSGTPWVGGYATFMERVDYFSPGTVTSSFDAGTAVYWTNSSFSATQPTGTSLSFRWATSNDNVNWSAWTSNAASLASSRYIRQEATLSTTNATVTPSLCSTTVGYSTTAPPPPTQPNPPTIGAPSALSSASIRWNFTDNADNETGFKVHDSAHTVMASSATADLTYLDETGLTANTQYTRHVHSYNATGDSIGSADASRYTLSNDPTGASATDGTYSDRIAVSWSSGGAQSGYRVYRDGDKDSGTQVYDGANSSFDDTITGSHTYYVYSKNGDGVLGPGYSSDSGYTSAPPAAPTIGAASALSSTSIRWNFTDNATNETGFKVHDASHVVKANSATTDLTYLDETGLTANTQYTRHVHSYNATGDSTGSADASRYTLSNNPTGASATDGTYTDKITVSWTSGGAQSGYRVYRDGDKDSGTQVYDGTSATFDDTITSSHTYYVYSKNGEGALSAGYSTDTGYTMTIPNAPTIGTASALSTTSIRWNFTDTANNEEGFKLHDSSHTVKASSATPNLSYLDETGLTADTQYTRHIHAYNAAGDSTGSMDATRYTLSDNPVSASASDGTYSDKITVSWTAGGAQSGYRVYRGGDKDTGLQAYNGGNTTFDDSVTGAYSYYIYSLNGNNFLSSGYVTDSGFTSGGGDGTPPSQVTGLSAVGGTSSTSMNLTWTAATDTGGSGLAGYKIERANDVSGAAGAYTEIGTSATTSYTDSTVTANTPYWYRVRAYDNAGNNGNYSTDAYSAGIAWKLQFDGSIIRRVAYSSSLSLYVAVGDSGRILTSGDSQNWTYQTSGTTYALQAITWMGTQFVAVGEFGTILTSPDGITWTSRTSGTVRRLNGITWSNSLSLYVAVGEGTISNQSTILTSPDAVTWTLQASGTIKTLYAVTWSGTQFAATVADGTVLTSPDGVTWTSRSTGRSNPLRDIIWDGTQFVVPGQDGCVYKSTDGISWTYNNFAGTIQFYSVAWNGTTYVVTGQSGVMYTSTDLTTWTPRASGTNNSLNGVTWSGTQFVAAGDYSAVTSSANGTSWTLRREGTSGTFYGTASSDSKAVAAGLNGTVFTSSNLTNWTDTKLNKNLYSITWSDTHSQFVEVGAGGVIRTSPDGLTWTSRTSGTTNNLNGVTWSGTQYVAVGAVGTILTSSDGISWTSRTSGASKDLQAVTWSGPQSKFIAVGTDGTILSSSDGITWSPVTDPDVETTFNYLTLKGVVWTGSQFITVGTYGRVYTSPDGATNNWTRSTDADLGTNYLYGVVWSGSQYVVVGMSGKIFTSPDASIDSWTSRSSGTSNTLYGVTWTGSQFIIAGGGGTSSTILTSADGVTWTSRTVVSTSALYGIAWSGTRFAAIGGNGITNTSSDGVTWTYSGVGTAMRSAVWSGTKFVAVGAGTASAPATVLTSSDGIDWTGQSSGTANNITLRSITKTGTQFIAVGSSGTIITSPDATTWTSRTSGTTNYLYGVTWSGTQFVATGASGTVLTSPDGINWTTQTSGTTNTLYGVAWSGSRFAAVGASGTIITSPDGVTWTTQTSGTANNLNGITWTGSQFTATGNSGTILTSPDGITWIVRPGMGTVNLNGVVWSPDLSRFGVVGATGTVYTSP